MNMDLDTTWENQLQLSGYVAEKWKPGRSVPNIKRRWLQDHGYGLNVATDCFFCDYALKHGQGGVNPDKRCTRCPGRLVDPCFTCFAPAYHYQRKPKEFYERLKELDIRRRGDGMSKREIK